MIKSKTRFITLKKYEKPDWYYYLYNLMTVRNKNDIAVDNAVVDHPDTMCGVLDKVFLINYFDLIWSFGHKKLLLITKNDIKNS